MTEPAATPATTAEYSAIELSSDDRGVMTIRLNSPRTRNALSRRMLTELHDALLRAQRDDTVRVIVLTGTDPAFCAGADLSEQQDGLGPGPVSFSEVITAIFDHRCPVVARVNGPARAGGLGLAAAADLAVAPIETTFAFTEVRIGVVPAIITVPVLQRIAPGVAHELFLTGEAFDGERAARIGLLNRAVPAAELDATVEHLVGMLLLGGPHALAAAKQLRYQAGRPPGAALADLLELSLQHFSSDEGQAGISALRAKTAPPWVPRRHSTA